MTKILVADDHALVRDGLRAQLAALGKDTEIVEARDWKQAFSQVETHRDLDLALLDLRMPGRGGAVALAELIRTSPTLPVVVLSATEEAHVMREALEAGAMGFVAKSEPSAVLLGAVRLVLDGGMYVPPLLVGLAPAPAPSLDLTPRQLDVLSLVVEGKSNQQIAKALELALATVKVHLAAVFRALGVANRTQAAVVAQRLGIRRTRT